MQAGGQNRGGVRTRPLQIADSAKLAWVERTSSRLRECRLALTARTPGHGQGDVLSVGHPHVCTGCETHGHWLLQPGDLDESLRTEPWLREVKDSAHAWDQELRVRHAILSSIGRTPTWSSGTSCECHWWARHAPADAVMFVPSASAWSLPTWARRL
jgi:hypothetical protein